MTEPILFKWGPISDSSSLNPTDSPSFEPSFESTPPKQSFTGLWGGVSQNTLEDINPSPLKPSLITLTESELNEIKMTFFQKGQLDAKTQHDLALSELENEKNSVIQALRSSIEQIHLYTHEQSSLICSHISQTLESLPGLMSDPSFLTSKFWDTVRQYLNEQYTDYLNQSILIANSETLKLLQLSNTLSTRIDESLPLATFHLEWADHGITFSTDHLKQYLLTKLSQ